MGGKVEGNGKRDEKKCGEVMEEVGGGGMGVMGRRDGRNRRKKEEVGI